LQNEAALHQFKVQRHRESDAASNNIENLTQDPKEAGLCVTCERAPKSGGIHVRASLNVHPHVLNAL